MNKELLKYYMAKEGYTIKKISKLLNINKATYSDKLNEKSSFNQKEINQISKILNLHGNEIIEIFFKK